MIKRDLSTPENREFWDFVSKAAKDVEENFPDWKRGDKTVEQKLNMSYLPKPDDCEQELAALKAKLDAVQKYASSMIFDFHFHRECEYRADLPDLCRTHNYEVCPVPTIKAIIDGTEASDDSATTP